MSSMISLAQKKQKGFTLVETLVGITVLLVAIVGPMTMAARGLQSAFHARDQITAVYLAQEAIEIIRAQRDQNALTRASWLSGISAACDRNNTAGCGVSARAPSTYLNCATSLNTCIVNDSGSVGSQRGFYIHGGSGTPTPFTRRIWVEQISGGREAEVTVDVSWQSGLFANIRTVRLQSRIFNHYDFLD